MLGMKIFIEREEIPRHMDENRAARFAANDEKAETDCRYRARKLKSLSLTNQISSLGKVLLLLQ